MWASCANQIDNSDEQKDTALFICVLIDVFNKYFLKGKMNTHTYPSPLDIGAFRNTFFSSLTRLPGPLQLTPSLPSQCALFCENPRLFQAKLGLHPLSTDNSIHTCVSAAVSSFCESGFTTRL